MCSVFIHCRSCKRGLGSDSENFSLRFFGYFAKENFLQSFFVNSFHFFFFWSPWAREHPLCFDNDYGISTIGNELLFNFNFTILQFLINCVKERLLWFDNGLLLST